MKCCGVEGYKDWAERNPFFDPDNQDDFQVMEMKSGYSRTMVVPESCCDPSKSQVFNIYSNRAYFQLFNFSPVRILIRICLLLTCRVIVSLFQAGEYI